VISLKRKLCNLHERNVHKFEPDVISLKRKLCNLHEHNVQKFEITQGTCNKTEKPTTRAINIFFSFIQVLYLHFFFFLLFPYKKVNRTLFTR
jgi:hypothetical protein